MTIDEGQPQVGTLPETIDVLPASNDACMDLEEWRKARTAGEWWVTPCGLKVKLKATVGLLDLIEQGEIPATLQPVIEEFLNTTRETLKTRQAWIRIVTLVCRAAILEPDDLDVAELPTRSREAIYEKVNPVARLRRFRPQQAQPVGTVEHESGVRRAAQRDRGTVSN